MKFKALIFMCIVVICVLVVSGCTNKKAAEGHAAHEMNNNMAIIHVDLQVTPAEAAPGEKVTFVAKVTYNEENVDDAQEVKFEFWKDGDSEDQHQEIVVTSAGEGKYVLEQTFHDAGTYHVISHVTAKDMHSMPSKQFVVK